MTVQLVQCMWMRMSMYLTCTSAAMFACITLYFHLCVFRCVQYVCTVMFGCAILFSVQYMLYYICIHNLHVCSAESKYVCVLMSACVYWMRLASDPNGPALGKKREGVREAMIKTSGSTPLKLMTVCLSDWIYLSQMPGKLASKWLWWQSPWISQMADTQNVYVHRTRGGSIKGQWREKEQGKKEKKKEGVRWCSIVR